MPRITPEVPQHRIHCDLAGKLSGGLPPHAVTDDEDAVTHIKAKIVLVVGADDTHVSFASGLDHQIHPAPVQALNPILVLVRGKYFWSASANGPNPAYGG